MHQKGIKRNWLKQVRGMKKVAFFKRGMKKTPLALTGSLASSVSTPTVPQNIPSNDADNDSSDDQSNNNNN